MIKLETKSVAPAALTRVVIESANAAFPSVILSTDEARRQDSLTNEWVPDLTRRKQQISFIDSDGDPSQLSGNVDEPDALEVPVCFRVVAECGMIVKKTAARKEGGFSGSFVQFHLRRVVEVWESPEKCLWRAKEQLERGGKVLTTDGKVKAA